VYRDSHRIHRGQLRRFSSPEVRFFGGERVPSRVPPYGGDRGEWTVVRRRRRKEFVQADGKWDRIQEAHRRGRRWEDFQRRRSRDRVQDGSKLRFSDMEDLDPFDVPVQTFDGNAALHYKTGRTGLAGRRHSGEASDYRRHSRESEQRASPVAERGRSLVRAASQQPFMEGRRHRGAFSAFRRRSRGSLQRAHQGAERNRSLVRSVPQQPYTRQVRARPVQHSRGTHQHHRQRIFAAHDTTGKENSFVSFYFTNVPVDISYFLLRQGFEVCGIMEDVYLAKKRNVNGGVFGFVRYGNVKDVDKLLKALNNVWFGDYRVVAKVASFDRFGNRKQGAGVNGVGVIHPELVVGRERVKRKSEIGIQVEEVNINGSESDVGVEAFGRHNVGVEEVEGNNLKDGVTEEEQNGRKVKHVAAQRTSVYIPKYSSSVSDMSWASKGVVVSVLNGDAIPVLQRRIFDTGFVNLVIIPLGADKVFLRSLDNIDISITLTQASEFFLKFFSTSVRWNKDILVRERGAWVRIYGVPLHAWNYDFFKLCVYDCGRLMRVDDITLDRDRFDYARVLVSTSSLELINSEARVLVDGVLFEFKIIEEWGFATGEDACLLDEAVSQVDDRSVMPDDLDNGVGGADVDELLNRLSEDWRKEEVVLPKAPSPVRAMIKIPPVDPIQAASDQVEASILERVPSSR